MKVWNTIKRIWKNLDKVPDCPVCNGTGEAPDNFYSDIVWWKGKQIIVCGNCGGSGKV